MVPLTATILAVDTVESTIILILLGKPSPIAVKLLTGPPEVAGVHDILKIPLLTLPVISIGGSGRVAI